MILLWWYKDTCLLLAQLHSWAFSFSRAFANEHLVMHICFPPPQKKTSCIFKEGSYETLCESLWIYDCSLLFLLPWLPRIISKLHFHNCRIIIIIPNCNHCNYRIIVIIIRLNISHLQNDSVLTGFKDWHISNGHSMSLCFFLCACYLHISHPLSYNQDLYVHVLNYPSFLTSSLILNDHNLLFSLPSGLQSSSTSLSCLTFILSYFFSNYSLS